MKTTCKIRAKRKIEMIVDQIPNLVIFHRQMTNKDYDLFQTNNVTRTASKNENDLAHGIALGFSID